MTLAFSATVGQMTFRMEPGSVRELYHAGLTLNQRNLFWSKGWQLGHVSEADMANYVVALSRSINATNVQSARQKAICLKENALFGVGEVYMTFLRRGPWFADSVFYYGTGGSINYTPDHDFRPDLWGLTYRTCVSTGAGSSRTAVIGDDWTTVESDTSLPKAFQLLTSAANPKLRFTTCMGGNQNVAGITNSIATKRQGNGDPMSIGFNFLGSDIVYGTRYEVRRAYLLEVGSLALDDTVLTDFRDDIKTPAALTFVTGSLNAAAAGDLDVDGFNERYGWHEVTCSGGGASFSLLKGVPNKRHGAAFRLSAYTKGASPTVTIAGGAGVAGTDYVIDDLGDGTAVLQLLTNRTADTSVVVA